MNQIRAYEEIDSGNEIGTTVKLWPLRSEFIGVFPKKTTTISNKIIGNFISYFVNVSAPQIILIDSGTKTNLFDDFAIIVERDREYEFDSTYLGAEEPFRMHAFLLPKEFTDDESGVNAVFYGANGRSVKRVELDTALGLKQIRGKYAYFGFIESPILNALVNQERTEFGWSDEFYNVLHRKVVDLSKDFLAPEIDEIRIRQAETVLRVRNEHLRFLNVVKNPEEFAHSLPLTVQTPEDIFLEMSRTSLRQYNRQKRIFSEAKSKRLPDFDRAAKEYTNELEGESLSSLAEYVYKRKLILGVMEDRLSYGDVDKRKFQLEEAVHELICPLRETTDTLGYDDHNLWIIDDSLAFYTYFASDNTIKKITGEADGSKQEPDLAIFDLGLGFERPGSSSPITIIEFKRPGRNNYRLDDNPFVQVRNYVQKLRKAGVARSSLGKEIRQIEKDTPFLCYIIADIEPTLVDMMEQFGPFHRKAGHGSYYKWDEGFKTFIEVSSYAEILRAAKARHEGFFNRLGINS